MSKPKVRYTAQFKQQMLDLVASGRRPKELAQEFGCDSSTISLWLRKAQRADTTSTIAQAEPLSGGERAELVALRRKLRQVQQERDILAKATAWFAHKSEQTYAPSISS